MEKIIEKYAAKLYRTGTFVSENKYILIAIVISLITSMVFSIRAAFSFAYYILKPAAESENFAIVLSIVILIILEVLNNLVLGLFFKFVTKQFAIYKRRIFVFGIFGLLLYSLSFYSASRGLSLRQSQMVDVSIAIKENSNLEKENTKAEITAEISRLQTEIETIKANPAGWVGNKRKILLPEQLQQIEKYNLQIAELRKELNSKLSAIDYNTDDKLSENKTTVSDVGSRYFVIAAAIMIWQLLSNFVIVLILKYIDVESNKKYYKEVNLQELRKFYFEKRQKQKYQISKSRILSKLHENDMSQIPAEFTEKIENDNVKRQIFDNQTFDDKNDVDNVINCAQMSTNENVNVADNVIVNNDKMLNKVDYLRDYPTVVSILKKKHFEGSKIPTYTEIADKNNISRGTVKNIENYLFKNNLL